MKWKQDKLSVYSEISFFLADEMIWKHFNNPMSWNQKHHLNLNLNLNLVLNLNFFQTWTWTWSQNLCFEKCGRYDQILQCFLLCMAKLQCSSCESVMQIRHLDHAYKHLLLCTNCRAMDCNHFYNFRWLIEFKKRIIKTYMLIDYLYLLDLPHCLREKMFGFDITRSAFNFQGIVWKQECKIMCFPIEDVPTSCSKATYYRTYLLMQH